MSRALETIPRTLLQVAGCASGGDEQPLTAEDLIGFYKAMRAER